MNVKLYAVSGNTAVTQQPKKTYTGLEVKWSGLGNKKLSQAFYLPFHFSLLHRNTAGVKNKDLMFIVGRDTNCKQDVVYQYGDVRERERASLLSFLHLL